MTIRWSVIPVLLVLAACDHSAAGLFVPEQNGAISSGTDVRLTLNFDQDYWPTWTQDGNALMYAFVQSPILYHRCIGMLRPAGGTRIWQFCDERFNQGDSSSSYPGFALSSTGQLLYADYGAQFNQFAALGPSQLILWLADTASPALGRKALLTLPSPTVNNGSVNWLTKLAWTGPNTFIGLAQLALTGPHCKGCAITDSLFSNGVVVTGVITGTSATLTTVAGTNGATDYSLAENGATVVFTLAHDQNLYKVPATGGTAVSVASIGGANEYLGISCRGSLCVVADDPVTLTDLDSPIFPTLNAGLREIRSVSLTSGASQVLKSDSLGSVFASPALSPTTGDVVYQLGGPWGHIQTFASSTSDLHLLPGIVH